ncbi:MAG: hypothetical protein NC818_06890 [Candidatus Omnitrophica bacterium]|nr:hypothetical protein [Candidatus Omnitrophota bacterium]
MRRFIGTVLVIGLMFTFFTYGCTKQKKAASSKDAVDFAKTLTTVEAKINYLLQQAKAFYNSKDFQQTIDIVQYILANLDKNSQEAKSLLEKAKEQLAALAQKKVDDLKSKITDFSK